MKKVFLLFLLVGLMATAVYFLMQVPTQSVVSASFGAESSIFDYASSYSGVLSRPLFPDISLFLPLLGQVFLSCLIIFSTVFVAAFLPKARKLMMLITTVTVFRHLLWRAVETLDFSAPFSVLITLVIYFAELMAFFAMVIGYFQVWEQKEEAPVSLEKSFKNAPLPAVDVMVCTYSEPISVLYRSLVGCLSMDYANKTVYLCDDGNRTEMRDLANRLGVTYISRAKNEHAKAGNLNNALRYSSGELVLVFDADHVPAKSFLKETVGYFENKNLGFVQTPQHFFTADPFQRNLLSSQQINNEQDLFFHVIQPGNHHWQSAFFAGSGAIFRREALQDVGGFAVETITEDVHTGMRIHSKGWESIYYNKDLAAGLAQESFADVIKQRLRWARGMTQIYILENPLFVRGLSLAQRLCYFTGIWYFFHGLPRLIFMVAPLFFLLFGFKTINSGFVEVLIYYLPSFLATTLGYTVISRGVRHSFWSEVYEVAFSLYISLTTFFTFLSPGRAKFRVTPKGGVSEQASFNWRIVFPQLLIAGLTILGIGMAVVRSIYTPEYAGGIYTNFAWALYNLCLLLGAIYVAQERPQFRLAPRIFRKVRCELKLLDGSMAVGYTNNISESGLSASFDEPIPTTGIVLMKLLDWDLALTTILSLQAVRSQVDDRGKHTIGFKVVNRTEQQHQHLIQHMFGSADVWTQDYVFTSTSKSLWQLISTPFRLSSKHAKELPLNRAAPRFNATLSCVLRYNNQEISAVTNDVSESGLSIHIAHNVSIPTGDAATVIIQWPSQKTSQFPVAIKRVQQVGSGQLYVALIFQSLSKAQYLDLIQQLYRPKERLVRVAPPVSHLVNCAIIAVDDPENIVHGFTQEVSELGAVIQLKQPGTFQPKQKVTLQVQWEINQAPLQYPAEVVDYTKQQNASFLLLYFDGLDMQALDTLSQKLHQPVDSKSFQNLIPE
ncbi:MAG: glycosyltransferase [Cyanobacteria bacterium P01_H01_bin.74]